MCDRVYIFLFISFLINTFTSSQTANCKLNIQNHLDPKKEPLILDYDNYSKLTIKRPEVENNQGVINIVDGNNVSLACIGKGNVNIVSNRAVSRLSCLSGTFYLENIKIPDNQIVTYTSCKATYACSTAKVTTERCGLGGNTGVIVQLGFEISDNTWIPLIQLCHNVEGMYTLYSHHRIFGQSLNGAVKTNYRKGFCLGPRNALYPGANPERLLSQTEQGKTLNKILGAGAETEYLKKAVTYFAKGHLAPDADFIYNSEQQLTYYHANTAPQWQPFNNGNWKRLETKIRKHAVERGLTLEVYTGTYGVTTLKAMNGINREPIYFYLGPTKKALPAPEVFWKLVHNPVTGGCIVAVGVNDVYMRLLPGQSLATTLCTPVDLTPFGWPQMSNYNDTTAGYTYYCTYQTFKQSVTYVPDVSCSRRLI